MLARNNQISCKKIHCQRERAGDQKPTRPRDAENNPTTDEKQRNEDQRPDEWSNRTHKRNRTEAESREAEKKRRDKSPLPFVSLLAIALHGLSFRCLSMKISENGQARTDADLAAKPSPLARPSVHRLG